ncbi:transposase [Clostridium felsineum]
MVLYFYNNNFYSSRKIEQNFYKNIDFMYLLESFLVTNNSNISRF